MISKIKQDLPFYALLIIAIIVAFLALTSCKQDVMVTEDEFKKKIDSVLLLMKFQDAEITRIKNRKAQRDTVIIMNHKKVGNEINHINNFNNDSRKRFADSVNRANNLN